MKTLKTQMEMGGHSAANQTKAREQESLLPTSGSSQSNVLVNYMSNIVVHDCQAAADTPDRGQTPHSCLHETAGTFCVIRHVVQMEGGREVRCVIVTRAIPIMRYHANMQHTPERFHLTHSVKLTSHL